MNELKYGFAFAFLVFMANTALPSTDTIGPNGINSAGLQTANNQPLTGAGIAIGQVEAGRPAKDGVDDPVWINENVSPAAVFRRDGDPVMDDIFVELFHGAFVASVLISEDTTDPDGAGPRSAPLGVAPGAALYSSADNGVGPDFDPESAISAQHIATRNNGDVRAINMSSANPLVGMHTLDGNQLLTQFVDWSAAHHNVLYVVSGNETGEANSVPTDNFNGITVASSDKVAGMGKYLQVAARNRYNQDAVGDRTSISLIAPGENVDVTGLGENAASFSSGTTFAAPHVTGTVALLQ